MKKGFLGGTALIGAAALMTGTAGAAEAPTWKLSGNANFQFYWVDQDWNLIMTDYAISGADSLLVPTTSISDANIIQDHGWYFGVDEAELQLNVSGTADNGLNYGFKIEINANTTDNTVVDEARLQFSGSWGTIQLGDEDGAEDIMNYGGESLMGATGGFDGDQDDYLFRIVHTGTDIYDIGSTTWLFPKGMVWGAPTYPTIAGDTSDKTKISYFSPRFSGFQVGASITPTPNDGDEFKADGSWENHFGIGANYDNSFGSLRIRASAVYSMATSNPDNGNTTDDDSPWEYDDVSAWSVGGIVGWGPFSLGANYTDNGESGQPKVYDMGPNSWLSSGVESSYWNAGAAFESGPMYFSVGYFESTVDWGSYFGGAGGITDLNWIDGGSGEAVYTHIALTADYTVAAGLGVYAEIDMIDDDPGFEPNFIESNSPQTNSVTAFILGANVSF